MRYIIAICDDDPIQINIIEGYLNKCIKNEEDKFHLIFASSGEELLEKVKHEKVHIFFLDIEMKGMNGLDVGTKLRDKYSDSVIVYITGFKDYAFNAFEIRAFDYIMKPLTYEKFKSSFEEVCKRIREISYRDEKEKVFTVNSKEIVYKVQYSDIYYFEKYLRKIKVVCRNNSVEYYDSFKNLKKELNMSYFTQCHQSFIVNNESMYSYKNHEIFIEEVNKYIPVSKSYVKDVKEVLSRELFG